MLLPPLEPEAFFFESRLLAEESNLLALESDSSHCHHAVTIVMSLYGELLKDINF